MTELERRFFDDVHKDRLENAVIFEKPSVRGFWKNIVEKYSDQAHFIYELLQNADDVGASSVSFELYRDRLVFRHNGKRHFSVSNPATEDIDSQKGKLGDINSITAIANSNKNNQSTIGKFGVGFKAVFLYTATPIIYDPNIAFRLERYIVPVIEPGDYAGRQKNETVFVFPFNHPKKTADEAYENISVKLQSLVFPQLFLNNIEEISFTIGEKHGQYTKQVRSSNIFGKTTIEDIRLVYKDHKTGEIREDLLWLCSRKSDSENRYCVGFFHNSKGCLSPKDYPAFCFFPTKEKTGLHFIIHAPFLLTDSREGIQAGEQHNRVMVQNLASLAAESLVLLRNIGLSQNKKIIGKNLFSVIPYKEDDFVELDNRDTISFKPFYLEILEILKKEEILPTVDGYVEAENAFWANMSQTSDVFSDKQLQKLENNKNAKWIDIGSGYQSCRTSNYSLFRFLVFDLDLTWKADDTLLEQIDASFIAEQSKEWLLSFYKYIVGNKERVEKIRYKPIFLDNLGFPSAAFKHDHGDQAILFLPSDDIAGFKTIHPDLAAHKETISLAKALEVRAPSLKEEIYNVILPLFNQSDVPNAGPNFLKFYNYYLTCSRQEADEFIRLISSKPIIVCHHPESSEDCLVVPNEAYMPLESHKIYMKMVQDAWVVSLEYYQEYGMPDSEQFRGFLYALGVKEHPGLIKLQLKELTEFRGHTVTEYSMLKYAASGTTWDYNTGNYYSSWTLPIIPGIEDALRYTEENENRDCSVYIWNLLLSIAKANPVSCFWGYNDLYSYLFHGTFHYFYRSNKSQSFETYLPALIRKTKWLESVNGTFIAPENAALEDLLSVYDVSDQYSGELIKFLNIQVDEDAPEESLSQKQREMIDVGRVLAEAGYTAKDVPQLLKRLKDLEEKEERECTSRYLEKDQSTVNHSESMIPNHEQSQGRSLFQTSLSTPKEKVLHDIWAISEENKEKQAQEIKKAGTELSATSLTELDQYLTEDPEPDEDDFTKPSIDYEKKIKRAEEKSAETIDLIILAQEYDRIARESSRYSYAWLKALLNLEIINSRQNTSYKQNISINFGKVKRESETNRTLILEHPDRYIPQSIEDISDVAMILRGDSFEKLVAIEVVNIRSYTLRVKMKNLDQINNVNLEDIKQATISIQNPVFLLDELRKAFEKLPLNDSDNLQQLLCENIRFVFGPPGTGKTTHLARKVIAPLMNTGKDIRVLVLTPTNKAADVLTARIMEGLPASDYSRWLIRFGITGDDMVERSGVYKEKTTDIRQYKRCTVVTTIARFPYDFFMPGDGIRLPLSDIEWDYIIIDEASMIPLINIIYPLYRMKPSQFIIAGDPFQIEPITSIKQWKNENIYTLTGLISFADHVLTHPYAYPVERLMTQYRSIPSVGSIFSNFAYGGVLRHNRKESDQKELSLGTDLTISSLNIIKFPTSKYESIYRPKKLNQSNYQIYSALFTFEFCRFLSERIHLNYPEKEYSIGIVAPYHAEADLIEKLINTIRLPEKIRIQAGTIHGFQGDECDIVIVVLNTPPRISASPEMFLNKKNIINVAVSRAKDYLFVIMPDEKTEGINNLRLIKKVEALCRKQKDHCSCFSAEELEKIMFGQADYLELNSFSTGHQSVNVYGLPEMKYEIRSEDTAVDVQIHEGAKNHEQTLTDSIPDQKTQEKNMVQQTIEQINVKTEMINQDVEPIIVRDSKQSKTAEEIPSYYVISRQSRKNCPFDHSELISQSVNTPRTKANKYAKLDYKICRTCGRKYLLDSQMAQIGSQGLKIEIKEILSGVNTKNASATTSQRSKPGTRYVYSFGARIKQEEKTSRCKWPGCTDKVFRNGLCWDHFQYEMSEN